MDLPGVLRRFIRQHFRDPAITALPSRRWLHEELLPALKAAGHKRVLFVGTQSYNVPFYSRCGDFTVFSIDPDPANARYGAPGGHYVGLIQDIGGLAPGKVFDVIVFNGVLGFGVNSAADAIDCLQAMALAAPEALLVVGWNPGRTDGQEIAAMRLHLRPVTLDKLPHATEFPPQGRAQRDPHRYEFYRFGTGR